MMNTFDRYARQNLDMLDVQQMAHQDGLDVEVYGMQSIGGVSLNTMAVVVGDEHPRWSTIYELLQPISRKQC